MADSQLTSSLYAFQILNAVLNALTDVVGLRKGDILRQKHVYLDYHTTTTSEDIHKLHRFYQWAVASDQIDNALKMRGFSGGVFCESQSLVMT